MLNENSEYPQLEKRLEAIDTGDANVSVIIKLVYHKTSNKSISGSGKTIDGAILNLVENAILATKKI